WRFLWATAARMWRKTGRRPDGQGNGVRMIGPVIVSSLGPPSALALISWKAEWPLPLCMIASTPNFGVAADAFECASQALSERRQGAPLRRLSDRQPAESLTKLVDRPAFDKHQNGMPGLGGLPHLFVSCVNRRCISQTGNDGSE